MNEKIRTVFASTLNLKPSWKPLVVLLWCSAMYLYGVDFVPALKAQAAAQGDHPSVELFLIATESFFLRIGCLAAVPLAAFRASMTTVLPTFVSALLAAVMVRWELSEHAVFFFAVACLCFFISWACLTSAPDNEPANNSSQ